MRTVNVKNFHMGIADDIYSAATGEFSISKQFDILSYPNRLRPLRGMAADTASTGIGNILVCSSNGLMYGVGTNSGSGRLWQRSGYGGSDVWQHVPVTDQLSGAAVKYPLLVEYPDVGSARTIFWSSANLIVNSDPAGASSANTHSLSFTNIGQGLVHPKDKILYVPYDNKIAFNNASSWTDAAFTLPSQYQIPCLTSYGNYLAIPAYVNNGTSVNSSIVYLSDRDTSQTTFAESISWGAGRLQVLNSLGGALIGISTASANFNGSVQDEDSILIKAYSGGSEPTLVKEIRARHLPGAGTPSVTINPNVNFVYKNRLYFSCNIVPNDGVSSSYYGLWSIGRNKVNGQYTVTLERIATNDNSETGVLAAAISGDFVSMVHTAVGTLTYTINGQTSSSTYGATSVYESSVNPEMPYNPRRGVLDPLQNKQLMAVSAHYAPLTSGAQAVMKYRVDGGSWTTIFTETTTGAVTTEMPNAAGTEFTAGRNYEFRLESTGGAEILGFSYKYDVLPSLL